MALSLWIRVKLVGYKEFKSMGSSGRPIVIIANHASFMDTILLVCLLPLTKVSQVKMFVANNLLKMPLLGTIVRAMGHLPVPFKSTEEGKFELDKELMAERQQDLETHLKNGHIGGWFPEGTMAPTKRPNEEVGMFRAGGFTVAVNADCEVWCCTFHGIISCWPTKAAVGGNPALINIQFFKLCDSTQMYLKENGKEDLKSQTVFIANEAQAKMQAALSEFDAKNPISSSLKEALLA